MLRAYTDASTTSRIDLLKQMFQTPENVNETELDGNIEVLSARRKQTESVSHQCQHYKHKQAYKYLSSDRSIQIHQPKVQRQIFRLQLVDYR